ncbi:MAG: carbonic anhydrase family protein [Opitutaceae bacterium]
MSALRSLVSFSAIFAGTALVAGDGHSHAATTQKSWAGTETRESQAAATPEEAIQLLKDGNARFASGLSSNRDYLAQAKATAKGQYPLAIILGCVDSRVPLETVFDLGIGDAFVARVAGNVTREDVIGSMEFATAAAGAKAILVVGHTACGAVKGAIDRVEMGNLTSLLAQIDPAVEEVSTAPGELRTSGNSAFVDEVTAENVRNVMDHILKESEVIAGLVAEGRVILAGGMYDLDSGKVTFFD